MNKTYSGTITMDGKVFGKAEVSFCDSKSKWMHWEGLNETPDDIFRVWKHLEDKSQTVVFEGDKVVRIFENGKLVYSYDAETK